MPTALIGLAVAAFAIGTTEFVIIGLIPEIERNEIARNLAISLANAGLLELFPPM
jgi:MFS transporter, DHA1 family, inner membrane transport protein